MPTTVASHCPEAADTVTTPGLDDAKVMGVAVLVLLAARANGAVPTVRVGNAPKVSVAGTGCGATVMGGVPVRPNTLIFTGMLLQYLRITMASAVILPATVRFTYWLYCSPVNVPMRVVWPPLRA